MRIGIDIDGVLTDIEQWQLDYGSKYYYQNHGLNIKNHKGYETNIIFNVSKDYDNEFWTKYFREYSLKIEPRGFASEVIKKLKELGNEIYIITARGAILVHKKHIMEKDESNSIVLNWLKENDIYYDEIIFTQEDKLDICKNNNIDIMIEDSPKNIEMISSEIPVICYHANYNEKCNGNNIYRAYSWYNILYIINNLNK